MRSAWALVAIALVLVGAFVGAVYGGLLLLKGLGGFWHETWRVLFGVPFTLQRVLLGVAVASILVGGALTPLAILERRATRAFAQLEEELRRERPDQTVEPYEGEEGEGVAFDGSDGRLLLLRPVAGVGEPRLVHIPRPEPVGLTVEAGQAPERPSPRDS